MKKSLFASAVIFVLLYSAFAVDPGGVVPLGMGEQPGMQQPGEGQRQPGEGQQQPDSPGSVGGTFIYDTFITESSGVGIDVRNGMWISTDQATTRIVPNSNLVEMAVGAAAGSIALTNVDLRMSSALGEIPSCAFAGCENIETVILPTSVTNVASDAFIGCSKLKSISYVDTTTNPVTPDQQSTPDEPIAPDQPISPDEPVTPNPPVEPDQPSDPDQPVVPDEPDAPDQPTSPDQPEEPGEPEPTPEPQDISFENERVEAAEGDSLVVRVKGGCTNAASSVILCLSYQTAAASDLDLAKASVDGVQMKLTFPLVLTWDAGEISTRAISIPVKTDASTEVDEQLTFQLASATGCDVGEVSTCTVILHDAKGSSTATLPLAYGLAEPADAGRITGTTRKAAGKTVTLKATANSGYVFIGWYDGETCLAQTTTLKFTMPNEDVRYTARFVTREADAAAISCALDGCGLSSEESMSVSNTCGVRLSYPIAVSGLSKMTVTASGLPTGMKLVCNKSTGAYSIEGIPVRESSKSVKFTVSSVGKSKRVFIVNWTIGALPRAAVGTWNGVAGTVGADETVTPAGNFTLTATAAGGVSAKAVTDAGAASFSGKGWIEDEDGILWMTMTNKVYGVLCVRLNPQTDWTEDSLSANITGGKFGDGILEIYAYRNPYGKMGKVVENPDAQNALQAVVGTWSVNVNDPDGETLIGTAKILKTGRVTVAGKLANGKSSYSMSGVLEVRCSDEVLTPSIRLVGVTKYGCLWCDEEVLK